LIAARKTTTWVLALGLLLALCVLTVLTMSKPSEATTVVPDEYAGNPTCADLGYAHGTKIDPPNSGTYNLPGGNTVTVTSDGTFFNWTSTLGMDAVIVKGGNGANAYVYDPPAESFGDNGLHSPDNSSGGPAGLSHIDFCYDLELQVSKTANTSLTRTHTWNIAKSVDNSSLTLQKGESFIVKYTIDVTHTGSNDSNWAVTGNIKIDNPDPTNAAEVTNVADVISKQGDSDITPTVDCGGSTSFTIPAGGSKTCTYGTSLPDGTDRTNTATVTTSASSAVGGGSAQKAVSFANATVTEKDTSVNVTDSWKGPLGTVTVGESPKSFTYNRDIGPYNECGQYKVDNTATFTTNDTGSTGSDDATVDVNVPCQTGCTLTIGYWKTHANPLSPRHDNTQTLRVLADAQPPITVGGNPVTATAGPYNVVSLLSFSGDASKPINKLYAQLVAAKLNIANGASGSAISTTIAQADTFLTGKSPNLILSGASKQTAVNLATSLESFNSGVTGPGHCSEQ
jgi:hypothetical protein